MKLKKITAAIAACAVGVTALTACGQTVTKLSFGETMKQVLEIENLKTTGTVSYTSNEATMNIDFDMHSNKTNCSLEKLKMKLTELSTDETIEIGCGNIVALVDGNVYISIPEVYNAIDEPLGLILAEAQTTAYDDDSEATTEGPNTLTEIMEEAGITFDANDFGWISVPMNAYDDTSYTASKELSETFMTSIENAIKSSETEIKNVGTNAYQVVISDKETMKKILKAAATELKTNKDLYLTKYKATIESIDMKEVINTTITESMEAVKKVCDELGIVYTGKDIMSLEAEIRESIDIDSIEESRQEALNMIEEEYDEMLEGLTDEAIDEAINETTIGTITYDISVTGKAGEYVINQKLTVESEPEAEEKEKLEITMTSTQTEEAVTAPAESKTITELIPPALNFCVENELIEQEELDSLKGLNLGDILASMQESNSFDEDFDSYDYSEDEFLYEYETFEDVSAEA